MAPVLHIRIDDTSGDAVRALLAEHLADMRAVTPPGSVHALDLAGLRGPDITFWTAWADGALLGCGALRELTPVHGEIKSMRTAREHRRKGVSRALLAHILNTARERHYGRLSLETGAGAAFAPARTLYESHGFTYCPPFGDYRDDPNSVFMVLEL